MKRIIFFLGLIPVNAVALYAQRISAADSSLLIALNQQIDSYVVQKNIAELDSLYAPDFIFSHGTGKVEGKMSWLATVARTNYPLRQHDSVTAELHAGVGIIKGKMAVQRINADKTDRYHLRYIRVYAWRNNRWQMISHQTTYEWHEQ